MIALNEHEFSVLELLVKNHELDLEAISTMLSIPTDTIGKIINVLIEKKLVISSNNKFILTEVGTDYYKKAIKKRKIFEKKEVYDMEPAGGINLDIGLVYEPVQRSEMVYNWMGKKGLSPIQTTGDKRMYFKIGETKFFLKGPAVNEDMCWSVPDYEIFEKWVSGKIKPKSIWEIYEKTETFTKMFFDTDTTAYHTL